MSIETAAALLRPGDVLRDTTATGCRVAGITRRANREVLVTFAEPWRIPLVLPADQLVTCDRDGVAR